MKNRKPLIDHAGEVRELEADDLALFRPAGEVLPSSLRTKLGVRGLQKAPTKERVTIRLSADVVARFRATGDGWQTRLSSRSKFRPALLLAEVGRGDWIACQITSNPYADPRAVELGSRDFTAGGLPRTSHARPGKLFTANENLFSRPLQFSELRNSPR
jgi:uncharacterized protein (DUF4415 family)